MSCYCRLIRRRRVVGISMLLSLPTRHLMDAIVVGHRKRHQIASCTEFTQKIHHADDDDDARHQAAQHHHHRPIAGRAPRRPCSDRSGCCGRTASSKCRRRQHLSRRQRQFFSGAVAIAMHLSTRNSSRGKRLLLAHPSIITASAIARPLSSSSEHHQIV